MTEYIIIVAIIAVAAIAAFKFFGGKVREGVGKAGDKLSTEVEGGINETDDGSGK